MFHCCGKAVSLGLQKWIIRNLKTDMMSKEEIKQKVAEFIKTEELSCCPVSFTPESVARLCYISVEDAAEALKALGR